MVTDDEKNRLLLCVLARSMAHFPLWAQKRRAGSGENRADGHSENCPDRYGQDH